MTKTARRTFASKRSSGNGEAADVAQQADVAIFFAALAAAEIEDAEASEGQVVFFSSRRRHTRLQGDWSSDVCSSDLAAGIDMAHVAHGQPFAIAQRGRAIARLAHIVHEQHGAAHVDQAVLARLQGLVARSEERRVGKECRSRWSPYH